MFDELLKRVAELRSQGASFALATVVRFDGSISGKPGDKAIIHPDGKIWGWIGGGCTQPAVIKESLKSIQDGEPRFVRITPPPGPKSEPRIVEYAMSCHSGGTLDVYIEPILPKPQLVIFGSSLVARYLAKLAGVMNFSVIVLSSSANSDDFPTAEVIQESFKLPDPASASKAFVVVSTQGEDDEAALQAALRTGAAYMAFVASRAKAKKVFEYLRSEGVSPDELSTVHSPAGLHISAVAPEEIALSIMAEIVQCRRLKPHVENVAAAPKPDATDPICGMTVKVAGAKHVSDFDGCSFYFCCAGCKQKFEKDPSKYLPQADTGASEGGLMAASPPLGQRP